MLLNFCTEPLKISTFNLVNSGANLIELECRQAGDTTSLRSVGVLIKINGDQFCEIFGLITELSKFRGDYLARWAPRSGEHDHNKLFVLKGLIEFCFCGMLLWI